MNFWISVVFDVVSCDRYTSDRVVFWYFVHDVQHKFLDDRT